MELDGARAIVAEADDEGPIRLRFALDVPLEDPGLRFLATRDGTLRRVVMPPVGGTLTLHVDGPVMAR